MLMCKIRDKGFFQIRGDTSKIYSIILGIIPLGVIISIWWFVTKGAAVEDRLVSPVTLPSPREVVWQIYPLLTKGKLFEGALASFRRVGVGFFSRLLLRCP